VFKRNLWLPVLGGITGVVALGAVAYAAQRRARAAARLALTDQAPPTSLNLRESMVVPRGGAFDTLEARLDLAGVFSGEADDETGQLGGLSESHEPTAQCDVKVPPLTSANDEEPPGADDLGAYWLSRATESERSTNESDLELELDNIADLQEAAEADEQDLTAAETDLSVAEGGRRG
jgi:hypothetical protein